MSRAVRRVLALVHGWQRVAGSRRASRDAARAHAALLAPGLWLVVGDATWRRTGTRLPEHLRRTRVDLTPPESHHHLPGRAALRHLPPPWGFVIRRRPTEEGPGTAGRMRVVTPTYDGGVLLLDPGRAVVRSLEGTTDPDRYTALRRRLARHVPSPRFVVDGRLVHEEFVDGRPVHDLPPEEEVRAVRALAGAYTVLTRQEAQDDGRGIVAAALTLVGGASLPAGFPRPDRLAAVGPGATAWPVVPSGADPQTKNVVVRPDGTPVVIDLGLMVLAPCFVFPLGLVASARGPVLGAYRDGALDDVLAPLVEAAGGTFDATPTGRRDLLALWAVTTTWYEARRLDAVGHPDRVVRLLAELWAGLDRA